MDQRCAMRSSQHKTRRGMLPNGSIVFQTLNANNNISRNPKKMPNFPAKVDDLEHLSSKSRNNAMLRKQDSQERNPKVIYHMKHTFPTLASLKIYPSNLLLDISASLSSFSKL